MKLGAYTACSHDITLNETLTLLLDLGLNGVELSAGGFIGTPHLPVEELLENAVRAVYIEHEDASFGQDGGLEYAARSLIKAAEQVGLAA